MDFFEMLKNTAPGMKTGDSHGVICAETEPEVITMKALTKWRLFLEKTAESE